MDGIDRLLTEPTNYAVVQVTGRKYPGVVLQGDSLHALVAQVQASLDAARKHADDDLNIELADALALLSSAEAKLVSVCEAEGIALPWASSPS